MWPKFENNGSPIEFAKLEFWGYTDAVAGYSPMSDSDHYMRGYRRGQESYAKLQEQKYEQT